MKMAVGTEWNAFIHFKEGMDWQSAFHKTSENSGVVCGTFSNRYKDGVTPQTF